jgi:hypothetical protein
MTGPQPPAMVPQIRTPESQTAGTYANGVGVWSTQTDITIDFLITLPPEQGTDPNGDPVIVAPQQVVSRVKIPPVLVFQLMRNLGAAQDAYEKQFGAIPDHRGATFGTPPDEPSPGES